MRRFIPELIDIPPVDHHCGDRLIKGTQIACFTLSLLRFTGFLALIQGRGTLLFWTLAQAGILVRDTLHLTLDKQLLAQRLGCLVWLGLIRLLGLSGGHDRQQKRDQKWDEPQLQVFS